VGDILKKLVPATEKSLFAMFKGFMDESGLDPDDIACTVAGFVGSGEICDKAADVWAENVKPIGYFHAEDFFRRPNGKMTGPYEDLDPVVADACVTELIESLSLSGLEPMGMAINSRIFRSLSEDERRWMTSAVLYGKDWPAQGSPNNPWLACFHYCITNANQFTPVGERIYFTFDRQETYLGNAQKIFNELRTAGRKWGDRLGDTLAFSSKQETVLLQAADLLAYSIGRSLNKERVNTIVRSVLDKLAYEREYVRAMDVKSIDEHLRKCPFRTTFWQGLSEPDLIEQIAGQGHKTLTFKADEGLYLAHHLKAEKVKVISAIVPQPLDGLNLTDRRDDSTN
jgi:hypothetical protein